MSKSFKSILFSLLTFTLIDGAMAVRTFEDSYGPSTPQNSVRRQVVLDQLFETIVLQHTNGSHVGRAMDKAKEEYQSTHKGALDKEIILLRALDMQFAGLVEGFDPEVKRSLVNAWTDNSWLRFSDRSEHTLSSRPVGLVQVNGYGSFFGTIDGRLAKLPLLTKIYKMILLTHEIGPQLELLMEQGVAFYQITHSEQQTLIQTSAYWTLMHWLTSVRLEKLIDTEIRAAALPLSDIRRLLDFTHGFGGEDPIDRLNEFLKAHHPVALMTQSQLLDFLQEWLNQSVAEAPKSVKTLATTESHAKGNILRFPPPQKTPEAARCASAIQAESSANASVATDTEN